MTLEDELPGLFDELADAHHVGQPADLLTDVLVRATTPSRRAPAIIAVVAAACIALAVGGLVILSGRNTQPAVSDQPTITTSTVPPNSAPPTTSPLPNTPGVAAVLAPPANSDVRVVSVQDWDTSGVASGAVVAPDGTVFSIYVSSGPTWMPDNPEWEATPPERRGLETVAGREVAAIVDASAPGRIYRTVRDECWSIEIVAAGAPMWDDNLTTLIGAITPNRDVQPVDEAAVTLEVPDGWTSLGGGRMLQSWTMELQVDIDGATHDVHLAQRPNAPVGVLLSGESNPVPFDHNGQQWWAVDIVTTPGMTSVIGHTGLGAFHITSDLSATQLVGIIDELVPTSADQLPESPGSTVDTLVEGMTESSTDTIAPNNATHPARTRCGALRVGLDLIGS